MENPQQILQTFRSELEGAHSPAQLRELRVKYLGKKSELKNALKNLREVAAEQRAEVAKQLNDAQATIESELAQRESSAQADELTKKLAAEWVDVQLPGVVTERGAKHPVRAVEERCLDVLRQLGFEVANGPEVESPFYNFDALNIPPHHPARDMQDTFFVGENRLLRTHTSPVQIRVMESRKPPLQIIAPGAVYRHDDDATHSPMFHQVEGFMVDRGITFADLKGVLTHVLRQIFRADAGVRFRPSFFPFTEPSAEIDIQCVICGGKGAGASQSCRVCKGSGWLEILGAGMIDPQVFRFVGYDAKKFSGFAFGMGVERIAMLKFGIEDIRLFYQNDIRFLKQFPGF
jgi:phenylalanyl-tRNA synthetase alpha chain